MTDTETMMRPNRSRNSAFALVFCAVAAVVATVGPPRNLEAAQIATTETFAEVADQRWATIDQYCTGCHNTNSLSGGLDLTTIDPGALPDHAETAEKVIRKLRGGMMPPPGVSGRPSADEVDTLVAWMEGFIDRAAADQTHPGRVALHRLNAKEYANAVRDLLAFEVDPTSLLPRDDQVDGFDNIAEVLQTTPTFFSQYIAAARPVAVDAVGRPDPGAGSQAYLRPADAEGKQMGHQTGLPLGTRGGFGVTHYFPADGAYEINVNDMFPGDIYFAGAEHENYLVVLYDDVIVYETTIGGESDLRAIDTDQSPAIDAINARLKRIRFEATAGPHRVGVTFRARTFAESDQQLRLLSPGGGMDRLMRITGFEVRGPFDPTGLSMTPSRERIFSCHPSDGDQATPCAEQILSRLARRAYRRPVTEEDVRVLMEFYEAGVERDGFEEGIRSGLTRILASPYFLYRSTERSPDLRVGENAYRLDDFALASRLSFFLWSSIPDDELLDLAEAGRLSEPEILLAQARRMLRDPRSSTLARNFAYQWLQLAALDEIAPDPTVFPFAANHRTVTGVDGDLRPDMVEEVLLFVDSVFREDRNVVDLLDADYTFLNEQLALHYDIPDVKGDRFRRVTLENPVRHGLLGKAAVLMVSSYPDRTSPVRRGAYIMENITGTPPSPPPPDVEALLEDNAVGAKVFRSVRERLASHRAAPSCNGCHGILDPLGFALDNFDAVGRWRNVEMFAGTPIDASGELPDGTPLDGPLDLRRALLQDPDQFVQTLTRKLLMYGLGRTVEYEDMPAVRAIVRSAEDSGYAFSAIVTGIVQSDSFRMETVTEEGSGTTGSRNADEE